jgi:hypothetical protein
VAAGSHLFKCLRQRCTSGLGGGSLLWADLAKFQGLFMFLFNVVVYRVGWEEKDL